MSSISAASLSLVFGILSIISSIEITKSKRSNFNVNFCFIQIFFFFKRIIYDFLLLIDENLFKYFSLPFQHLSSYQRLTLSPASLQFLYMPVFLAAFAIFLRKASFRSSHSAEDFYSSETLHEFCAHDVCT